MMTHDKTQKLEHLAQYPFVIAALYTFTPLNDLKAERDLFKKFAFDQGLCGTLLLAHEGVNGTLSGSLEAIQALVDYVGQHYHLPACEIKFSGSTEKPFKRLKVRLKQEIVTLRQPQADPNQQVGTYLEPQQWDDLIAQEDVLVLDTRNTYETVYGMFKGAVDPRIDQFTDFVTYVRENLSPEKHKRVAMYCTGGIRCEKASSFMLAEGFEEVYHLKGGILRYMEQTPQDQSTWHGRCFVFDERVSVDHDLKGEDQS
jgi:UPF0176 protein